MTNTGHCAPLRGLTFFIALLVSIVSHPVYAVELTGQIRGIVTDSEGMSVPGANLQLSSGVMQGDRSGTTNADASFRFAALPPGEYKLEVKKGGFQTLSLTIAVNAGRVSRANAQLTLAGSSEEIVVVEEAMTIDTTAVQSGTVMTAEMLRDIPNAGRDYQSATEHAAGVTSNGTGNPNVRGSLAFGNQYYVDGVNVTDPLTSTFSMNMNFDAIEEVQVITGGMDAEFGRSMGGAINVVTRSGGNEFSGDVQMLYSGTKTYIYEPLPDEEKDELQFADQSLALNLGGPLVKDKLWFFSSVQLNHNLTSYSVPEDVGRPANDPMPPRTWNSAYLFGKVTWKPHANHRLWVHGQTDPMDLKNSEQNPYGLSSSETWWQQGGWLASLGHQYTPSANTIVDSQLYTQRSYIRDRPMQWLECESYDELGSCEQSFEDEFGSWFAYDPDGFSYGPMPYAYYTDRSRTSFNSSVTQFFDFLGSHQAKVGVQADLLSSHSIYPGLENGIVYNSYSGDDPTDLSSYSPTLLIQYDNNMDTSLSGNLISWYIQDAYQPIDRLTLRPGLRFDFSSFVNNRGNTTFSDLTVAPRFGMAYDLTNDGRTNLHAYVGRFYDSGFLEIADLMSEEVGGYAYYNWDEQTDDWSNTSSFSVADEFLSHDDLVTPYSDEFDIGIARDVGGGWGIDFTFTYEEMHNYWEDDEVNLIWDAEGSGVVGSRDGTGEARWRLRTPDEAWSQYTSLETTANKVFDEHWGMLASYTWSHAYGRYRSSNFGMATWSFDIPEQQDYEVGLLPYDVPHQVKVAGSYREAMAWEVGERTAVGYLIGWNFLMRSGYPYRPTYYNETYQSWGNYREVMDGSYRLPAYAKTDLKLGLSLIQGKTNWDLTVECFNLFNSRTVTDVETTYDDESGEVYTDDDGELLFGSVLDRQSPRYLQFGLRGDF